jgi:hypothetical protein
MVPNRCCIVVLTAFTGVGIFLLTLRCCQWVGVIGVVSVNRIQLRSNDHYLFAFWPRQVVRFGDE